MKVFILAGQSNMAGRGSLAESVQVDANEIFALEGMGESSNWKSARDPIHLWIDTEELRVQANSVSKAQTGVGPGVPFASTLLTSLDTVGNSHQSDPRIGLVPTAVGGTSIEFWCPGGVLFETMIDQTQRAMRLAAAAGWDPQLAGLLFHQGESDALDSSRTDAYSERLEAMIAGARDRLGAPALPVVVCAIGGAPHRVPLKDAIRAAQLACPSRVAGVACAEAGDLEFQADGLHLTAAAQRVLGARLADAWLRLAAQPSK